MPEAGLRVARSGDADAIARIYNHYILKSTATFHTRPVDTDEREQWMIERGDNYPTVVAEEDGAVCAWGSLSRYASRPGWDPTVEVSIYVDPSFTGRGMGQLLMDDLIHRATALGYHTAVSQISGSNHASIALAHKAGFAEIGRLREAGFKLGERLDVVIMQLMLEKNGKRARRTPPG